MFTQHSYARCVLFFAPLVTLGCAMGGSGTADRPAIDDGAQTDAGTRGDASAECDDGDPCTDDVLDELSAQCSHTRIPCGAGEACDANTGECSTATCAQVAFTERFEEGDGGFTHRQIQYTDPWNYGTPTAPKSCFGGSGNCWGLSYSRSDYPNCTRGALESPTTDLTQCANAPQTVRLAFQTYFSFEPAVDGEWRDGGLVQFSADSGATWEDVAPSLPYTGTISFGDTSICNDGASTLVVGHRAFSGSIDDWTRVTVDIEPRFRTAGFRYRFVVGSDSNVQALGWFVDDVSIEVR